MEEMLQQAKIYLETGDFTCVICGQRDTYRSTRRGVAPLLQWLDEGVRGVLDVEMNAGQMLEDIKLALNGAQKVEFFGHCGSHLPTVDEIRREILRMREE